MENENEWELSKENIQPLQHGRKPDILKAALTSHPDDPILKQRQTFEGELRMYSGDDPLSVWCKYIWWAEQSFPKGGKDGQTHQLYQKCLDMLKNESKYYDDARFVEIWIKYARISSKPIEVYSTMYSHNIGCKDANFFVAWSWELEQRDNMKEAHSVIEEGLRRRAVPYEKLQSYLSELEERVVANVAKTCSQNTDNSQSTRTAFSMLKPQTKKNLAPVLRTGEAIFDSNRVSLGQQPHPKKCQPQNKLPFKICNSENTQSSLPLQTEKSSLFILQSNRKENEIKPSKWNKVKLKPAAQNSLADAGLAFQFHCDDQSEQDGLLMATPRSVPKMSNILKPLQESKSPALALFEPPDPMVKPMYNKAMVYRGAEEFSFEEIRAVSWFKRYKEVEQARKLAEQEQLLKLKEEKEVEMRRQIQALMQEVELLKTNKCSLAPPTISDCIAKESCNDPLPHTLLNVPRKEQWSGPYSPASEQTHTNEISHRRNLGSTSYKEAADIVQDFYNYTLSNHTEVVNAALANHKTYAEVPSVFQANSNDMLETGNSTESHPMLPQNAFVPFSVYRDPTENIKEQKCIFKQDEFQDKNNENIPPLGYVQDIEKRELNGILEPSKNVEWAPIPEDDLDPEENCIYKNSYPSQDVTLIPPCNTEQFVSALHLASTPCGPTRHKKMLVPISKVHNPVSSQQPPADTISSTEYCKTDVKIREQSVMGHVGSHLSVIMETSKECYKSGSSSGSSVSVTKLSHCFSSDRSSTNRHFQKSDIFKEPYSVGPNPNAIHAVMSESQVKPSSNEYNNKPLQVHVSDVDPFSDELNDRFLQSLNFASNDFKNVEIVSQAMKTLKVGETVQIGDVTYTIESLIAEGSYGKVYEAEKNSSFSVNFDLNDFNTKVALKACKNANNWELYICKEVHRRLEQLKAEPDIKSSVMDVTSAKCFTNGLILVNEFSSQGTLLDLVNFYKKQGTIVPEIITVYITWEMMQIMSNIHACKIVHADVKPDNILLQDHFPSPAKILDSFKQKTSVLKFIDFGRGIDLTFFKPGISFTTVVKDGCIEMKENKPWVFQQDWQGILKCIHILLFSEYMKVKKNPDGRWGLEKKIKRYWDQSIWEPLFDQYLNISSCYDEPNINEHLQRLEEKLKANGESFKKHFEKLHSSYDVRK